MYGNIRQINAQRSNHTRPDKNEMKECCYLHSKLDMGVGTVQQVPTEMFRPYISQLQITTSSQVADHKSTQKNADKARFIQLAK